MENLDLNIDNYSLQDLLNLFKLPYDFNDEQLKQAQKVVYKTHPDKSQLDKKYFLFFMKALKTLVTLNNVINKKQTTSDRNTQIKSDTYDFGLDKTELKKRLESKNFNKWFNDIFEKNKMKDDNEGYQEWLKSNENIDDKKLASVSEMDAYFRKKKEECKALVRYTECEEMNSISIGHTDLSNKPQEYSSDIFSKLQYDDLKKAHTQSVIPVTNEDFAKRPVFNNVSEYNNYRSSQNTNPLNKKESLQYLSNKNKEKNFDDLQRAFNLHQQDKKANEINMKIKTQFNMIKN